MANFSYLIQKKFRELNSDQQRIFIDEFEKRKKSVGISYLLWFFMGWHYAYLNKWGWLILYILTLGGFFIWAVIDLFRIPTLVARYNNDLALGILRDISIMFPSKEDSYHEISADKKAVNDIYIANKMQSENSYSFYILIGLFLLGGGLAFMLKTNRDKMQNEIVDDLLLHQPQVFKMMKNFFGGEELDETQSTNLITFFASKNGYKNITIYDENLVFARILTVEDDESQRNLITAYGIFGFTKVMYDDNNLKNNNLIGASNNFNSIKSKPIKYTTLNSSGKYQKFERTDFKEKSKPETIDDNRTHLNSENESDYLRVVEDSTAE